MCCVCVCCVCVCVCVWCSNVLLWSVQVGQTEEEERQFLDNYTYFGNETRQTILVKVQCVADRLCVSHLQRTSDTTLATSLLSLLLLKGV